MGPDDDSAPYFALHYYCRCLGYQAAQCNELVIFGNVLAGLLAIPSSSYLPLLPKPYFTVHQSTLQTILDYFSKQRTSNMSFSLKFQFKFRFSFLQFQLSALSNFKLCLCEVNLVSLENTAQQNSSLCDNLMSNLLNIVSRKYISFFIIFGLKII